MPRVILNSHSIQKADKLVVRAGHEKAYKYEQMQVEIYSAGVLNPEPKLGIGTKPTISEDGLFEVEISTDSLQPGLFEVLLIRFHSTLDSKTPEKIDVLPRSLNERVIFEVIAHPVIPRSKAEIYAELSKLEHEIEEKFAAPFQIVEGAKNLLGYSVFVFIRDLLVGTRIRFPYFELLPTRAGLESIDTFNFVNMFLDQNTKTNVFFNYTEDAKRTSVQSNPVCVVHFPNVEAQSQNVARDYCVDKAKTLLLALALSRDAGGSVFDVVVFCHENHRATKFSVTSNYIGNLLIGNLSGENADTLHTYLFALESMALENFLTQLYREARRERHVDFQYVRLWQILEIIAEGEDYDPAAPLMDYEGNLLFHNDGSQRLHKGSVHCVYAMLRDNRIGKSKSTWENVNKWFSVRCAVAHYGSISNYENLKASVKEWAIIANKEISENPGHDRNLWELKEDVKLLLQRRLVTKSL
ncbi:hypothetical protein Q6D67_20995 [Haliea sp. E1-2-M8]|uniref:hypothetical protein n=1 Tax=Haliea sp. E1-2-M8 TaxID=3064706 RepID=UPI002720E800|nr:hypothetical protein [Haliea sp. E1-2-M8]MDO8864167.1 hypothetical protein [Haliea sp. E1-2-M8]